MDQKTPDSAAEGSASPPRLVRLVDQISEVRDLVHATDCALMTMLAATDLKRDMRGIVKLHGHVKQHLKSIHDDVRALHEAQKQKPRCRTEELEEALRPFAEAGAETTEVWDDDRRLVSLDYNTLRVRHVRRAQAVLANTESCESGEGTR